MSKTKRVFEDPAFSIQSELFRRFQIKNTQLFADDTTLNSMELKYF